MNYGEVSTEFCHLAELTNKQIIDNNIEEKPIIVSEEVKDREIKEVSHIEEDEFSAQITTIDSEEIKEPTITKIESEETDHLSEPKGTAALSEQKKQQTNDHFDDHADQAVQCRAHCPVWQV